jgi:hypothetical protein
VSDEEDVMVGAVCAECGARKTPLHSNAVSAAEFGPELVRYRLARIGIARA